MLSNAVAVDPWRTHSEQSELSPQSLTVVSAGGSDHIVVTVVPEKEGIVGFKHINYHLTSSRTASQVVRRYSDFVWLSSSLLLRYPFRSVPLLPPKSFSCMQTTLFFADSKVNGHYLAGGDSFVEQRRRGLSSFINAVIRHPTFKDEFLVAMFLTELSVWRKQTPLSVQEEFLEAKVPPHYDSLIPKDLESKIQILKRELGGALDTYVTLCQMFKNLIARNKSYSNDYKRISMSLGRLSGYPSLCSIPGTVGVSSSLSSTSKTFLKSTRQLDDESHVWDQGILQDLKMERDSIISLKQVFERRDKLFDKVPELERNIAHLIKKTALIKERKETPKEGEIEDLEEQIAKNKTAIQEEKKRRQLIQLCIKEEISYFQMRQIHVGKMLQDYTAERIKFAQLQVDTWNLLSRDLANISNDTF